MERQTSMEGKKGNNLLEWRNLSNECLKTRNLDGKKLTGINIDN